METKLSKRRSAGSRADRGLPGSRGGAGAGHGGLQGGGAALRGRAGLRGHGQTQQRVAERLPGQVRVRAGTEETGTAGLAGERRGGGGHGGGQHRVRAARAGAGLQGGVAGGGRTQRGLPGGHAGAGRAGEPQVGGGAADWNCAGLGAAGRGQRPVQQWELYLGPGRDRGRPDMVETRLHLGWQVVQGKEAGRLRGQRVQGAGEGRAHLWAELGRARPQLAGSGGLAGSQSERWGGRG